MNTTTTPTSRKVLVPLATLLVAGAVAIGSGATFTSTSDSAISATAGTLVHDNSEDGASLAITNLKPGASETGSLTITNEGSLNSTLKMDTSNISETFLPGAVTITIKTSQNGAAPVTVDSTNFAGLAASYDLGTLDADYDGDPGPGVTEDEIEVFFTVAMAAGADNDNQGKAASVDLDFVTTQTSAVTDDETTATWTP